MITISEGAEVVFDGPGIDADLGNADAGQFGIVGLRDAKITFKSGEFKAGWYGFSTNGNQENAPEVHLDGGRFISTTDYAVYLPSRGKTYISGDTYIDGYTGGIAVQNGEIYISGNPIITTAGAASQITATYSDGTSVLENLNASLNLNARYGNIVCRISGGKFIGGAGVAVAVGTAHNVDLKISGGAFSQPVDAAWLEEGYVCKTEANAEGLYEVVKADVAVG